MNSHERGMKASNLSMTGRLSGQFKCTKIAKGCCWRSILATVKVGKRISLLRDLKNLNSYQFLNSHSLYVTPLRSFS